MNQKGRERQRPSPLFRSVDLFSIEKAEALTEDQRGNQPFGAGRGEYLLISLLVKEGIEKVI